MGQYWRKCVQQVVSHWYYSVVLNYDAQEQVFTEVLRLCMCCYSEEYLMQGFDHLQHFL